MNLDKYYKEHYLIFLDIEFQTFNIKSRQQSYILELGVIIFEKGHNDPVVIDHVNFPILPFENIRLIGEEYATVSKDTETKMIDLENKFILSANLADVKSKEKLIQFIPNATVRNILKNAIKNNDQSILDENNDLITKHVNKASYNLFYKRMPKEYQDLFKTYMNLYKNDKDIKKRMVNPKDYLNFLNKYIKDGLFVHKETTDLEAMTNHSFYYKVPILIKNRFDIAVYNKDFSKLDISPSLHRSYVYLYDEKITKNPDVLKFHNKLLDLVKVKMERFIPHDPLVDAFMTIFVFLLMKK